jgi:toxin CcdB
VGQYSVHTNLNAASQERVPYLLDVQCALLDSLSTRIVVPLSPTSTFRDRVITTLMPILRIGTEHYVMVTPDIAGIARRSLGPEAATLWSERYLITEALKLALYGF